MSNHIVYKILLIIAVAFAGSGCKELSPPFDSTPTTPRIPPRIPVAPGNAQTVFSLAKEYAAGQDSLASLTQEFAKLSPAQLRQLAQKKDENQNFLLYLAQGLVNDYIVALARDFFNNIPPELVVQQVKAVSNGLNAFQILRGPRDPRETSEKRLKLIALMVIADPPMINLLKDNAGNFDPEEFNEVIKAIPAEKVAEPMRVVEGDKLIAWLNWATADLSIPALNGHFFPTYPKIYSKASPENKARLRNASLEKAYDADTNEIIAGNPPHFVADFIGEMPRLGLAQNLADDLYELNKNPAAGGKHIGSFLYAVTKRIADDRALGAGLSWDDLRAIAKQVKQHLAQSYETHVTANKFGPAGNESILSIVTATGVNPQKAKLILHLPIELDDIYQELKRVATKPLIADRRISADLKDLLQDYLAAEGTLDAVVDITVPNPDNGQGNLVANDKFIHVLSTLTTDADLQEVLELLVTNADVKAKTIVEENALHHTALYRLTDLGRVPQAIGGNHNDIITYLLSQVLQHGDAPALERAFNGIHNNALQLLVDFAYEKRASVLQDGATVASVFARNYGGRVGVAQHNMAKLLVEKAYTDAGIGNANSGVIAIINQGFLTNAALQHTGYNIFNRAVQLGNNNTLFYELLMETAARRIATGIGQANPQPIVFTILNSKIRGRSINQIRTDAGVFNLWTTNTILPLLSGSLEQAEVHALAHAFKAALGDVNWQALAQSFNATTYDRLVWELLEFSIMGGINEATARTAAYLDY